MADQFLGNRRQVIMGSFAFLVLAGLMWWTGDRVDPQGQSLHWYSCLPPLLAICLVVVTQKVIVSMAVACIVGGLLSIGHLGGVVTAFGYVSTSLSDQWNIQILIFVPFIMAMISLMVCSGGFLEVVKKLSRVCRGRVRSQLGIFSSGLLLFFDDYANSMVIGSGMRPLADKHKISRSKLSFIVDATSAPIAGLAVISTWIGYEIGLFKAVSDSLAMRQDGFSMFLDAIPFRFYCMFMIIFVILNILLRREYGPMARAERQAMAGLAEDHGRYANLESNASIDVSPYNGSIYNVALPIGFLFLFIIGGFWVDGGGMALLSQNVGALFSLGSWQEVLIKCENSVTILMSAAICGFIVAWVTCAFNRSLTLPQALRAAWGGVKASLIPMLILVMAWSLKNACDDLNTAGYIVATLGQKVTPMIFPALVFLTAGVTAFSTGSSWGTMAILIPAMAPVAFELDGGLYGWITMATLGAVLDGSIFGDHCSPISDTTIMASSASQCDHIAHVRTQAPYALTVAVIAILCGYIPAVAFNVPTLVCLALAAGAISLVFFTVGRPLVLREPSQGDRHGAALLDRPLTTRT